MRLRSLILGLMLALGGCAGLTSPVAPPEVSLAGLGFGRPGMFEQELRVDLRVSNPNDFSVPIESLRFDLEINELRFAQGRTSEEFELPALGETVVPVTVTVPTGELVERVMQLGVEQRLDYRLSGAAEIGSLFGLSVPFEREGKLALPRIPGITAPGA